LKRFAALSDEMRALVAMAVLCDGSDAPDIVVLDRKQGNELAEAALELLAFDADVRLSIVATELRDALVGVGG